MHNKLLSIPREPFPLQTAPARECDLVLIFIDGNLVGDRHNYKSEWISAPNYQSVDYRTQNLHWARLISVCKPDWLLIKLLPTKQTRHN